MPSAQTAPGLASGDSILEPTLVRCRQFLAQGQPDPALALAREFLAGNPEHYQGLKLMGQAHMARHDFDSAVAVFRRLVQQRPREGSERNALGLALLMGQRTQEARLELEEAVRLNPKSGTYQANLGKLLMMQEEWLAALERLQEASALVSPEKRMDVAELITSCRANLGLPEQAGFVSWRPPETEPISQPLAAAPGPAPEPAPAPAQPSDLPRPAGFTRWTPPEDDDDAPTQSEAETSALADRRLNILFVQESPCIRNYKMASALKARGHRVSLAWTRAKLSQMYKGLSDEVYDECIQLTDWPQMWDLAQNYDLVHCHNEPDLPTVAALGARVPVIHDTHDLISLRAGGDPNLAFFEGLANRGATGRVYTTAYQLEEARRLYGVSGPSLVLMNYASAGDLPQGFLPKLSASDGRMHLGYEGGIGGNTHRDFLDLFTALADAGLVIHIHPNGFNPALAQLFGRFPNIHYYEPVSPKEIMTRLSAYDAGIIPFNLEKGNRRFLDSTVANKLFEYLAAGLPVVTSDLASYRDFFAANPVGFTFEGAGDLLARLPQLLTRTRGMDLTAYAHTYEGEIQRLEEFYYQILHDRPGGEPQGPTGRSSETGTQAVAPFTRKESSPWAGLQEDLGRAVEGLHGWASARDWTGYDPYDLPAHLLGARLAGRITPQESQALLSRQHSDPLGLRQELGIAPQVNAKAMGLFASSYALLQGRAPGVDLGPGLQRALDWLLANPAPDMSGLCWGYPFDWESVVMIPAGAPTGVISYHAGDALWAMWRRTGERVWLERCLAVAEFMARDLNQDWVAEDIVCFSYTPLDFYHVHNANLCVSEYLIRLGQAADKPELTALGASGVNFAMRELTPQGYLTYWAKGFEPAPANVGQMDHYHTAAELRGLLRLTLLLPERDDLAQGLTRYLALYLRDFFDGPMPKLHPRQAYPLDIHAAAEAAYVLGEAAPRFPEAAAKLMEFVPWFLDTCRNEDGSFLYRIYREGDKEHVDRTPYMRWGQAWTMRGLAAAWLAAEGLKERG